MFKGVETPVVRSDSNKYRPWRFPGTEAYIIVQNPSSLLDSLFMLDNFEALETKKIALPDYYKHLDLKAQIHPHHCKGNIFTAQSFLLALTWT